MKVVLETKKIRDAVNLCLQNIGSHLVPILQMILLNAEPDQQVMTSFNSQVGIKVTLEDAVAVQEEGKCLIPASKLKEILAAEKSESLILETKTTDRITIKGDTANYSIATISVEEYPDLEFGFVPMLTINTTEFRTVIKAILPFVCKDNYRDNLSGILLDYVDGNWFAVSGDGKILAVCRLQNVGEVVGELPSWMYNDECKSHRFLLSSELVKNIYQMNDNPVMQIGFSDIDKPVRQIVVKCGNTDCKGVMSENNYPNWVPLLRTHESLLTSTAAVNRELFAACLKKSMIGATTRTVTAYLTIADDVVSVANRESSFVYSETIPAVMHSIGDGGSVVYCIDPVYALAIASSSTDYDLRISYSPEHNVTFIFVCEKLDMRVIVMLKRNI